MRKMTFSETGAVLMIGAAIYSGNETVSINNHAVKNEAAADISRQQGHYEEAEQYEGIARKAGSGLGAHMVATAGSLILVGVFGSAAVSGNTRRRDEDIIV